MIQMRPSVAVSAVVNSIRQFYDAGSGVTQTTMLGASGSAPALYEDFTTGQALDPRITFTRASSATRFDSTGTLVTMASNEPRFDYDPVTLQPKGLLIEEQRTNLVLRSQEFDTAAWTKTNSTIAANAIIAPDGTLTADKLIEDTVNSSHIVNPASPPSVTTGTPYTVSIFAKAAERQFLQIRCGASSQFRAIFNLTDGAITDLVGATAVAKSIANGWYLCSLTFNADTSSLSIRYGVTNSATTNIYTGDGTSGLYIWGAQLEAGAFATSYIPTTTAAATRAADVATMTGTDFSSWYNQTEGALFVQFVLKGVKTAASQRVLQCDNGAETDRQGFFITSTNALQFASSTTGGNPGSFLLGLTVTPELLVKVAAAYKLNDLASAVNGSLGGTDTLVDPPVVNTLRFAASTISTSSNIWFQRITYYPRRLSNSELQAITA